MGSSTYRFVMLGLILGGATAVFWLGLRFRSWIEATAMRRRFRRGARGQQRARTFLERAGFQILSEEHEFPAVMEVDGERLGYTLRIDYLVRRRRRTYGVEVKTGERAPDPLHRATRRQLLEYEQSLPVDGLLLLDMEQPRLMEVTFPRAHNRSRGLWFLALGFVLGLASWLLTLAF